MSENDEKALLPDVPIQINFYQGQLYVGEHLHMVKDEQPVTVRDFTEDLFLRVLAIRSAVDAEQFIKEFPGFRLVETKSGLVPSNHYFGEMSMCVHSLKSAWALSQKYVVGGYEKAEEVANYITKHESLHYVFGWELIGYAENYLDFVHHPENYDVEDPNSSTASRLAGFYGFVGEALKSYEDKLRVGYMSMELCNTVAEAMWRYGYKRVIVNGSKYRKCGTKGCNKYFSVGPMGQMTRVRCDTHSRPNRKSCE